MRQLLSMIFILGSIAVYSQNVLAEYHFTSKDSFDDVIVEGIFCDIKVVGGGDELKFDGIIKGDGKEGDYFITSIANGSTIIFKVERQRDTNWGWSSNQLTKIELIIPDNFNLQIKNTSGDVKIESYNSDELLVKTTSGDIELKKIEADCDLRSTSGDLMAREVTGAVEMVSTSGDQEYYQVTGNLEAQATSGDIDLIKVIGAVEITATSGDIDIDGLKGSLRTKTTSGNVDGDFVTLMSSSAFKSTSGDIHVTLKNELNELSFKLRATSGDLRVGAVKGDDNLSLERGDILIEGISTSGNQTYDH